LKHRFPHAKNEIPRTVHHHCLRFHATPCHPAICLGYACRGGTFSRHRGRILGFFSFREALFCEALRRGWVVLDWNTHAINFYERFDAKRLADWLPYRLDRPGMERLA
jgi:hypothetical protein